MNPDCGNLDEVLHVDKGHNAVQKVVRAFIVHEKHAVIREIR